MDIQGSPAGKTIQSLTGHKAFIPNPLPPNMTWNSTLVNALSRADYVIGQLAREGNRLPNPQLLMRPFITCEAVLSSKIEGTQTTLGEILATEAGARVTRNPDDLQEVRNYIVALDYGLELLDKLPLSLRLIKAVHAKLMQGVRGGHATPGELRRSQNWIGPPGCTLETAKYVPPPPGELIACLGQLESFLHNRQMPTLIHIGLCHYQFEAIHPFLDGNGRMGRLLITLLLIERKMLPSPLLYLSAFFEATRDEYYRQLFNVSNQGSWDSWLIYFLNGVALQAEDVLSRAEQINTLLDKWQTQMGGGGSQVPINMIQHFAVNPYLTTKNIAKDLGITYSTAQRNILKLQSQDIIQQINPNKRDKVYCATEILNILEAPIKIISA